MNESGDVLHTVIYVDVLLAVNMLLTYVLLLLTCLFMKSFAKTKNLLAGSAVGAIFSLTVLLPDIGTFFSILLKSVMCVTIVLITFRWRSLRLFVRCLLFFLFANASLAGMIMLLQNLCRNSIFLYRNANVYCNIDLPSLLIFTVVCYGILRLISLLMQKNSHERLCRVKIFFDDKYAECPAITDSGNSLTDPISGRFVNIVSLSVIEPLLPTAVCAYLQGDFSLQERFDARWSNKLRLIQASFAKGASVLPAVRADKIIITDGKRKFTLTDCLLAVTTNSFDQNDYKMLLHPCIMQEFSSQREETTDAVEIV